MPKKRTTPKPQGRNLIAENLFLLREGRDLQTLEYVRESLTQKKLAEKVSAGIEELLSSDSPPMRRQREKAKTGQGEAVFRREDISKIEAGTRYVRDYELIVLADVLGVEISDLANRKGVKK